MTKFIGAVLFLIGIGCIVVSLSVTNITGEHAAVLAVAAFTLLAALGIWNISDNLDKHWNDNA